MAGIIPLIIISLLAFVLTFGVAFILNMLLKTTWFPMLAYVVVMVTLFFYYKEDSMSIWDNVLDYGVADWLAYVCGMSGVAVSGWAIRLLRIKGFQMF